VGRAAVLLITSGIFLCSGAFMADDISAQIVTAGAIDLLQRHLCGPYASGELYRLERAALP